MIQQGENFLKKINIEHGNIINIYTVHDNNTVGIIKVLRKITITNLVATQDTEM